MPNSSIIVPKVISGWVSHSHALGVANYDLDEQYSPDSGVWKSKVLDLGSPKYNPNKTYWFDRSRYQNHGTITGATWKQLPSGVWVLSFDGTDDYVENTTIAFNWTSSDWTLLIWAKNDAPDASDFRGLAGVRFGAGAANWWTLGQYGDANRYMYFEYTGGAAFASTFKSLGTGWHLYAIVHSGTLITCTRDNNVAVLNGDVGATNIGGTTNDFRLGQWFTASQIWLGLGGLSRIFNRALSAVENTSYYNQERHLFGI